MSKFLKQRKATPRQEDDMHANGAAVRMSSALLVQLSFATETFIWFARPACSTASNTFCPIESSSDGALDRKECTRHAYRSSPNDAFHTPRTCRFPALPTQTNLRMGRKKSYIRPPSSTRLQGLCCLSFPHTNIKRCRLFERGKCGGFAQHFKSLLNTADIFYDVPMYTVRRTDFW